MWERGAGAVTVERVAAAGRGAKTRGLMAAMLGWRVMAVERAAEVAAATVVAAMAVVAAAATAMAAMAAEVVEAAALTLSVVEEVVRMKGRLGRRRRRPRPRLSSTLARGPPGGSSQSFPLPLHS